MSEKPLAVIYFDGPSCTDELYVRFYTCTCGFERVPRLDEDEFDQQTRYCPYCATRIEWKPRD